MSDAFDDELLSSDRIRALLAELGDELAVSGDTGELFLVGGAALALAFLTR